MFVNKEFSLLWFFPHKTFPCFDFSNRRISPALVFPYRAFLTKSPARTHCRPWPNFWHTFTYSPTFSTGAIPSSSVLTLAAMCAPPACRVHPPLLIAPMEHGPTSAPLPPLLSQTTPRQSGQLLSVCFHWHFFKSSLSQKKLGVWRIRGLLYIFLHLRGSWPDHIRRSHLST